MMYQHFLEQAAEAQGDRVILFETPLVRGGWGSGHPVLSSTFRTNLGAHRCILTNKENVRKAVHSALLSVEGI